MLRSPEGVAKASEETAPSKSWPTGGCDEHPTQPGDDELISLVASCALCVLVGLRFVVLFEKCPWRLLHLGKRSGLDEAPPPALQASLLEHRCESRGTPLRVRCLEYGTGGDYAVFDEVPELDE
ncbi:hypothetical protein Poly30_51770 [Planctomycetes bacterium Poly30]|uniref:Uncharacterized protein n=1 Tax=Saltatorellus ferox TaxID=2528018 RepID=A0A518EZU1_9BACT|nr:hypothetical protein Poly30_08810 [Planctomycetes bacterium Poly30]QDV06408.1 hypothetical protein Poly30_19170 [Planctomycetes bacterium Poly30]QDV07825.1 hypothetical protein Poly30_33580 [Planctomycetes bacterium Poly30]QDV09604.1 hypothetical protein Poly30_51620 [Planctomycetes bacterium Poly30]QDV09619.1 hypothetical protein Poly30_51770 [Planctomycetes bacterium Poly30]